jgi:hypothetical protein
MAEAFGVKGEAYDDLDELAARYVEPVQARMQALVAHRKWKAGSWEQVQVGVLGKWGGERQGGVGGPIRGAAAAPCWARWQPGHCNVGTASVRRRWPRVATPPHLLSYSGRMPEQAMCWAGKAHALAPVAVCKAGRSPHLLRPGTRPPPSHPAQEELRAEKARVDARMAVTCLGEDAARGAGAFYLAFITSNTPRREFFAVTPNGFYFRKHVSPAAAAGSSPAWAGPVGRLCSADACRRAPLRCMRSAHHSPYRPPPLFRRHTPALMPC